MSPLLFVVCMEFLFRILNKSCEFDQFQYRTIQYVEKCNLHICVLQMTLYYVVKGSIHPCIYLLLQAFKLFSDNLGLKLKPMLMNQLQYTCGMQEGEVQRIIEASSFQRSILPFRYLGVPICAKSISKAPREIIIEKMTTIIRL